MGGQHAAHAVATHMNGAIGADVFQHLMQILQHHHAFIITAGLPSRAAAAAPTEGINIVFRWQCIHGGLEGVGAVHPTMQ